MDEHLSEPVTPASQETSDETGTAPATRHNPRKEFVDFLKIVALIVVLLVATREFIVEGYEVQGPSMIPTLQTGERILVFKLPFRLYKMGLWAGDQPFEPGDIIVFDGPDDSKKRYVKRLIAQGPAGHDANTVGASPADDDNATLVRVERDAVYVNNQKLDEQYLVEATSGSRDGIRQVELHSGEYFMMGDNRDLSKDSRAFGPVEEKFVIGKAILRIWPLRRFGLLQ